MSDPGAAHIVLQRDGPPAPWVGQLVRVDVALWRPRGSEGELPPFHLDDLDIPGAIAVLRAEAPPPSELEERGVLYLVQHRTLLVFPQEDGEIVLPPVTAYFDDPATAQVVRVTSDPLSFAATAPRGLSAESSLLVARGVKLASKTDRSLDGLAVGDGFIRRYVLTADDTDAIMLPELGFAPVEGLRVYPAAPRAWAAAERGAVRAGRSYSATYVVERVGRYELPGASVRWLDPASGRYATAQAEPIVFWARPNPSLGFAALGSAPGLELGLALGGALLLGALGYLARRRLRSGPFAWERRRAARMRERRAFLAFERSLAGGMPLVVLGRAYAWLALRSPGAHTLACLRAVSAESAGALRSWEEQAFAGREDAAPARGLRRVFAHARRALGAGHDEASISEINPRNE